MPVVPGELLREPRALTMARISLILIPLLCMVRHDIFYCLLILLSNNKLFIHRHHPLKQRAGDTGQTSDALSLVLKGQFSLNSPMKQPDCLRSKAQSFVSITRTKQLNLQVRFTHLKIFCSLFSCHSQYLRCPCIG